MSHVVGDTKVATLHQQYHSSLGATVQQPATKLPATKLPAPTEVYQAFSHHMIKAGMYVFH